MRRRPRDFDNALGIVVSEDGVQILEADENEHSSTPRPDASRPASPVKASPAKAKADYPGHSPRAGIRRPPEQGPTFEDRRRKRYVSTRKPGQPGTKALVARYGERFRSLRYVYDREARRKYREIILLDSGEPWDPGPPDPGPEDEVGVAIALDETELRKRVAAAGGRWDRRDKLWYIHYGKVRPLGLANRTLVVKEEPAPYLV
jgi:hypothetical protein